MKKKLPALALSLSLLLTGCSAMLERDYLSVTPHDRLSAAAGDSSAVWVENYQELVNTIYDMVRGHQEEGVVRLRNWEAVEESLTRACEEVSHDDPIGAYAVDRIQPQFTRMVGYYEATISIDYRRTAEQIAAVTTVTGSGAIRAELLDALSGFVTETAFRVNYFDPAQDAEYIRRLIREAYYSLPAYALGMPEAQVTLYPDSGSRRVVEVVLAYPEAPEVLQAKSLRLEEAALELAAPYLTGGQSPTALVPALYDTLREQAVPDPEDGPLPSPGSTAYAALVEGYADSEGMALAYKALCDLTGVECVVAEGSLGEERRFWTIVTLENGHRHVDPSREDGLLLTDAQMEETGFTWTAGEYPACTDPSAHALPVETEEN